MQYSWDRVKKIALTIFFLSLMLLSFPTISSAAEDKAGTKEVAKAEQYTLPYPGILPDNPLYKLKILRDRISVSLINDPVKKAEFYLHQADKQMAMIPLLLDKQQYTLASQTAYKAEHNVTELTFVYKKSASKPNKEMYEKIEKATRKHQEVLLTAIKKGSEENKKDFQQVINFSKTNWTEIQKLYKSKKQ